MQVSGIGFPSFEYALTHIIFLEEAFFIPQIELLANAEAFEFVFSCCQFPIRLAFAMTKAQGQLVKYVGVDLETPVFGHGTLHVALSRCTSASRIKILTDSDKPLTRNMVYPEALLPLQIFFFSFFNVLDILGPFLAQK